MPSDAYRRLLLGERILDIRRDVRSSVNHVGAIDHEQQLLARRNIGGRTLRLIHQRFEELILFVGDRLVELLVDLLLVGVASACATLGANSARCVAAN